GEVRAADVADLAGAHQAVERTEGLLDRRQCVEGVQLVEVDGVGAEPPQAGLDRAGQVIAGGADVVGARPDAEGALGGEEHLLAASLDRLAQDLLCHPLGIDVGRVEQGEAGFEADIDEPPGLGDVAGTPGPEQLAAAAEGAGPQTQPRNLESRAAELSIFHDTPPFSQVLWQNPFPPPATPGTSPPCVSPVRKATAVPVRFTPVRRPGRQGGGSQFTRLARPVPTEVMANQTKVASYACGGGESGEK